MGHLILLRPSRDVAVSATPHLTAVQIADLVDGTLAVAERAEVERHLANCDDCRDEVAVCAQLVASAPVAPKRRIAWRIVVPLAAGILFAIVLRRPDGAKRLDIESERGTPSTGTRITLVAPAPDAAISAGAPRFVWRPIEGSTGYRIVIKDASGTLIWTGDVADTSIAIPDTLRLRPGQSYVWRVDGQRTDGTTASSPETVFRVAR
jgi:hypothetical protein